MKKLQSICFLLILTCFGTACVGPLLNHESGRTVGDGKHLLRAMSSVDGYFGFTYDYGLSKNFDLGVQLEALAFGLKGKYSFINSDTGFAAAALAGIGTTFGGTYYTFGAAGSFSASGWEHFGALKYTQVNIDPTEVKDSNTGSIFATIPAFDYNYTQAFLGTKYRFTDWFALSAEAGSFIGNSSGLDISSDLYISLSGDFNY